MPGEIAILDIGKTNAKISVASLDHRIQESRSRPNIVLPGPPWPHHDLAGLGAWVGETLADLCRACPLRFVVPVAHGSGGVLTGDDLGADGTGALLPMPDYEAPCPPEIDEAYRAEAGSFADRGSTVLMASTHTARQLFRMEAEFPEAVAAARWYLNAPQYWAWWLSGVAASEATSMGAQSHFWNVPGRHWSPIVERHGWKRIMPPFRKASDVLGPVRPALAARFGLPGDLSVLTGAHDSSANFFRYLASGLSDFTLVSTGTWIVALSGGADVAALDETRGMTVNADPDGNPVGGALTMGGREFAAIAGPGGGVAPADPSLVARLVRRGTMAVPSFAEDGGQFPGSALRGRIEGPPLADAAERTALGVLQVALLTVECASALGGGARIILDGTFLSDPAYPALVAALREGRPVAISDEPHGVAAGAAALARRAAGLEALPAELRRAEPTDVPGLRDYALAWRDRALANAGEAER